MMGAWGKEASFYLCKGTNLFDLPELPISPAVKLCKCNTFENETLPLSWILETPDCGVERFQSLETFLAGNPHPAGKWEPAAYSSFAGWLHIGAWTEY